MWNRRDLLTLSSAALATCAITLALSLPRLAVAINDQPPATTDVDIPTLTLEDGAVSAALDPAHPHTVILTVRNTSAGDAQAQFVAVANVSDPTPTMSRTRSMGREVWKQQFAIDLKAGETKAISVPLPDAVFAQPETKSDSQRFTAGSASLSLWRVNGTGITAITLWTGTTQNAAAPESPTRTTP